MFVANWGIWGGGGGWGAKYFFSGPKCPPSRPVLQRAVKGVENSGKRKTYHTVRVKILTGGLVTLQNLFP